MRPTQRPLPGQVEREAWFSPDRLYRYALARTWGARGPTLNIIALNPSGADEHTDDPTIRRCVQLARRMGCARLLVTNLFAWRAATPELLKRAADPVGEENDAWIRQVALQSEFVLAGWGIHGAYRERNTAVCRLLQDKELLCLGCTRDGHPRHPLYVRAAQPAYSFSQGRPL